MVITTTSKKPGANKHRSARRASEPPPMKKRSFNKVTADAVAAKKRKQQLVFADALKNCQEEGVGAKKCLSNHPEWKEWISWRQLHDRLKGKVSFDEDVELHVRRDQSILTDVEENALVEYAIARNLAQDAAPDRELGEKVRQILLARRSQNREGGGDVHFTKSAYGILSGKMPSDKFFLGFYSRHSNRLVKRKMMKAAPPPPR